MTQRKMTTISTCINLFCAFVWMANFFIHWCTEGTISLSTGLFGVAAACFAIAGLGGLFRLRKMPKEEK